MMKRLIRWWKNRQLTRMMKDMRRCEELARLFLRLHKDADAEAHRLKLLSARHRAWLAADRLPQERSVGPKFTAIPPWVEGS